MDARQLFVISLMVLGITPLECSESSLRWGAPSHAFSGLLSNGDRRPSLGTSPDEQGTMEVSPAIAHPTGKPAEPLQLYAQDRPNQPGRDRFLQPSQPIIPGEQPVDLIPPPSPQPLPPSEDETVFEVQSINVVGSTIFAEDDERIDAIVQPLINEPITLADLSRAAAEITGLYLEEGYITSRAIVEPQPIDGSVTIRVIEGEIERIDVNYTENSSQRLRQAYIRNRLNLGIETPVNVNDLEEQLRLLLSDPLIENIEPTLEPGSGEGQSVLTVLVTEADGFSGNVGVDNYTPPSIGSVRFGANLAYRNVTGIGDSIAVGVYRTASGGSTIVDLAYRAPVNPMNGTLQVGGQINRNEITTAPLDAFDVDGESERIEISYRQPIVRSLREEFALSLGFSFQDGQTFVFDQPTPFGLGPDEEGISRTSVFRFGQDYVARDPRGAWSLRSLFNFGTGLFDATTNDEPIPDGHFFSWTGQVQRAQRLGNDHLLLLGLDLQLTPDSLLPSEQFVIGGGQSVRGYRQNARSGDNGIRFSIENRITIQRDEAGRSIFQIAPFLDLGAVWNQADNPNTDTQPDQRFLIGSGLGILWEPFPEFNIRLNYGFPFIDLDDRGNDIQDDGLYFDIRYGF